MTAAVSPAEPIALPVVAPNPHNVTAAALTGRDYLSHTQVTTFQACPLRWYFAYVAGLPQEQVAAGLVFGGSLHAALERHHRAMLEGESSVTADELLAAFDAAWQPQAAVPIQFSSKEDADSLRDQAARMIGAFLESEFAQPAGTILAVDDEFRGMVLPDTPDLLARVDLVLLTEEALVIRDYKTARARWDAAKVAEAAGQLLLYGELARMHLAEGDDRPIRLEFVVVTKTKTPTVERHVVPPDEQAQARTRRVIRQVWQAMAAGHIYPNPSPLNCAGCPFQQACRNWEG